MERNLFLKPVGQEKFLFLTHLFEITVTVFSMTTYTTSNLTVVNKNKTKLVLCWYKTKKKQN